MKPVLAALALVIAVGLLVWSLAGTDAGHPVVATRGAAHAPSPAIVSEPLEGAVLDPELDTAPQVATRVPEGTEAQDEAALEEEPLSDWKRGWLVHLELVRADELSAPVIMRIRNGSQGREVRVDFTKVGKRTVGVTELRSRRTPEHLIVAVEGFVEEKRSIRAQRVEGTDETVEFAATIDIGDWNRHFEGRVVLPIEHVQSLEQSNHVGVYVFDTGGRFVLGRGCDPSGGFSVPLLPGERYFVAAFAPGLAPHTEIVEPFESDWPGPREFPLGEGAVIEGRGTVNGESFAIGSTIRAERDGGDLVRVFGAAYPRGPTDFGWLDEQLVRLSGLGHVEAEGRFRITGLHPGRHELRASARLPGLSGTFLGEEAGSRVSAVAPTSAALINIILKSVTIAVRSNGAPLDAVWVQLQTVPKGAAAEWDDRRFRSFNGVDQDGRLRLAFESVGDHLLRFERPGYATQTQALPGNTSDETHFDIDMEPLEAPASALLVVNTTGDLAVRMSNLGGGPFVNRIVERGPDGYLLENLPPGRYDTSIGLAAATSDGAFLLPAKTFLSLRAGRTVEHEVALATGGMIQVSATGFADPLVAPRFIMRDAEQNVISALTGATPWRPGEAKSLHGPLPPGTYGLLLSAQGFKPWTGSVEIRPGEVSQVQIPLVRSAD